MQQKPESFTDEDVKIRNSNMPPSCIHHVFFTNHELSFFLRETLIMSSTVLIWERTGVLPK
jgi:hypothetical protein